MLDMKKVLAGAAVAAGSLVSTQALAETTGSLNITSEYMFRGVDSSGGAAVQGSFDWASPSGVYAGSWVSNVTPLVDGTEVDVYFGWAGDMGNGLGVDLGFVYYAFPEQGEIEEEFINSTASKDCAEAHCLDTRDDNADVDYWEIYAGLSYGGLSGSVYYADDFFGSDGLDIDHVKAGTQAGDGSMVYFTVAYTAPISDTVAMTFQVGNSSGEGVDALFGDSYTDWSITTSKDLGDGWGASGAYVQTDIDDDDPKFVVSVSKEFAL